MTNWLALDHLAALTRYAGDYQVKRYLEIGTQEGNSLRAVLDVVVRPGYIVVCDTWGPSFGGTGRGSHNHIEPLVVGYDVHYLDGDSKVLIPEARFPRNCFDLTLVDGDHSTAGALADLRNVWPISQVVAIHDLSFPEVWCAVWSWLGEVQNNVKSTLLTSVNHNGLLFVEKS